MIASRGTGRRPHRRRWQRASARIKVSNNPFAIQRRNQP
jgi:hypothetical protein